MSDLHTATDRPKEIAEGLLALPYHIGGTLCGVALFIVYVVLARWSYYFVIPPGPNAVFWLPSGLTAFLMIYFRHSKGILPYFVAGLFFGELYIVRENGLPVETTFIWATANLALAVTLALVSRKLFNRQFSFACVRDVFSFILLVPVSVIPGALIAGIGGKFLAGTHFFSGSLAWGLSDALGIILVAPPLFAWTSPWMACQGRKREALVLFASLILFSGFVLFHPGGKVVDRSLFSFLIFFAAWAAIRFGARGTTLALVVIDIVEVYATSHGVGTFANLDLPPAKRLFTLQILVANLAMLMLILAAALEEQSDLREKAVTAARLRDDFISVASHELKTPLTSLTMEIQILNNYIMTGKIRTVSEEKLKKLARISDLEIKRFTLLINDLLDVSRITSGRMTFEREELDLFVLVNEAVVRLKSEVDKSGSIVTVTGQKNLKGLWDKMRMEQMITNLLSNAIKYGCGRPVLMEVREEHGRAVLCVRDKGMGIPPEDQARIFQRFERAVSTKDHSGLGLGLFIARQIVEAHGGTITVESELGHGSLFRVELPLIVEEGATHPYWQNHGEFHGRIYH